jgi:NAD/NADP transhydrogenase alpha subunit
LINERSRTGLAAGRALLELALELPLALAAAGKRRPARAAVALVGTASAVATVATHGGELSLAARRRPVFEFRPWADGMPRRGG